jgi:hypothetical protein
MPIAKTFRVSTSRLIQSLTSKPSDGFSCCDHFDRGRTRSVAWCPSEDILELSYSETFDGSENAVFAVDCRCGRSQAAFVRIKAIAKQQVKCGPHLTAGFGRSKSSDFGILRETSQNSSWKRSWQCQSAFSEREIPCSLTRHCRLYVCQADSARTIKPYRLPFSAFLSMPFLNFASQSHSACESL